MSTGNGPTTVESATGLHFLVIAASWHTQVMDNLLEGAVHTITQAGGTTSVVRVPGTFELSVAAAHAAALSTAAKQEQAHRSIGPNGSSNSSSNSSSGPRPFDAIVALGVVIRGGTPHFEYVCNGVTTGLTNVSTEYHIPVGFGVLTCNDDSEATARSSLTPGGENKGREAAQAAISTVHALRAITASLTTA